MYFHLSPPFLYPFHVFISFHHLSPFSSPYPSIACPTSFLMLTVTVYKTIYSHTNGMWMTPRTNTRTFCLVLSSRRVYMGNLTFYYLQPHSTCHRPKSTCHQTTPIHKFMFKKFITQEQLEIYYKLSYIINVF